MINYNKLLSKASEIIKNNKDIILGVTAMGCVILSNVVIRSEYGSLVNRLTQIQIESELELKEGYYNKNQILDKFYEIDGKKIPVEVDGTKVVEYFR